MKSQIKNELVAFKCPTPFKNKLVKYANLEMVSISDIIRRGTIAEVANNLSLAKNNLLSVQQDKIQKSVM